MARLLVPFLLLSLLVAGSFVTDRPQPPADFYFVNREVNTLDPQRMSWMQDLLIARGLFEGLVRWDPHTHDFDIIPGVAHDWEISSDGLVYTFHLREDARWTNGEPVIADHFIYAWRRALTPDTGSYYTGLFQHIKGGSAFYQWRQEQTTEFAQTPTAERELNARELWEEAKAKFDEMVGLEAVDDHTLRIELERPTAYFLDLCAFAVFSPVYPPLVSRYERPDPTTGILQQDSGWTRPERLVSNGPFMLTTWRFKRDMRLEQNPYYWDRESLNIETMVALSIEDPNAQVLAFNTGVVDWLTDVSVPYRPDIWAQKQQFYDEHREEYERLKAKGLDPLEIDRRLPPDPRKNIHGFPSFGTYWFNFNCSERLNDGRDNPFRHAKVRRAFAKALNKERIVDEIRRIDEPVAHSLIPPGSLPGYEPPEGLSFNPSEARRLFREAGYDPSNFITVELLFNSDAGHDLIAQSAARDWEEHLGVSVRLEQKEVRVFRNDLKNQNFMISRAGWFGDYGDPTTFLDLNRTGDGNNDRNYSNAEYDALLDKAANENDPERRLAILQEAERIIMEEDLPMVPVFHYVNMYMFNPDRISGPTSHPRQFQNIYLFDVLDDGKGSGVPRALPPLSPEVRAADGRPGGDAAQ